MPTYEVQDEFGNSLTLEGDRPPTEEELEELFAENFPSGIEAVKTPEELSPQEIAAQLVDTNERLLAEQQADEDMYGDQRTILGRGYEFFKAIPRGFGASTLSAGEGIGELSDAVTNLAGYVDLIDDGDSNALIAASREGRKILENNLGADEVYRNAWSTKLGEGIGSFVSFFGPAGLAKVAGLTGKAAKYVGGLGTGTFALGTGSGEQAQRIQAARESGIDVSEEQEDAAIVKGGFVGLSELIPIAKFLKSIRNIDDTEYVEGIKNQLASAALTGTTEGVQEVVAKLAQDAIERGTYNENLPDTETLYSEIVGLDDDFTVGASIGFGAELVLNALAGRAQKARREAQLEHEAQERKRHQDNVALAEMDLALIERGRADPSSIVQDINPELITIPDALISEPPPPVTSISGEFTEAQQREFERQRSLFELEKMYPYAQQIARIEGANFPFINNKFSAEKEGEKFAVLDSQGNRHGTPLNTLDQASALAGNLNDIVISKNITKGVLDRLESSPEAYDRQQTKDLLNYGLKLNNPDANRVTKDALNQAAETTVEDGYETEGYSVQQLIDNNVSPRKYTASQKINANRLKQGLPEESDHSLEDVKSVIDPKFFDQLPTKVDRKVTTGEIFRLLKDKNITSEAGSPELRYLYQKFAGIKEDSPRRLSDYTKGEINLIFEKLDALPAFSKPTKIPNFRLPNYTSQQFSKAVSILKKDPEIGPQELGNALGINTSSKKGLRTLKDLKEDIANQGAVTQKSEVPLVETVVNRDADQTVDDSLLNDLSSKLSKQMEAYGLKDVGVNVDAALRTVARDAGGNLVYGIKAVPVTKDLDEQDLDLYGAGNNYAFIKTGDLSSDAQGFYSPNIGQIFLGLDRVKANNPNATPEQAANEMLETMDHEIVHAMRQLDVFKRKEWEVLSKQAKKKIKPDDGKSYIRWAAGEYADQNLRQPELVEEAVAEMIKDGLKDNRLLSGKPKSLASRTKEFFVRLGNALDGSGFTSFNDVVQKIESGEIGRRDRGVVRTSYRLEKQGLSRIGELNVFTAPVEDVRSYYKILDVSPTANNKQIELAHANKLNQLERELQKGSKGDPDAQIKITDINVAKNVLLNPERREMHDIDLSGKKKIRLEDFPDRLKPVFVDPDETPLDAVAFSRRKSSTPIQSAINIATTKYADYNSAVEEEFFGSFWPKVMKEIKGTTSPERVRTAAKRAIRDAEAFIAENPKYRDYYAQDMAATREALEKDFGTISDDDMLFYQLANGLTSPATVLSANVGDSINMLRLYKSRGNLDDIEMGLSKKGNPVITKSPFKVSGTTAPTKARSLKVMDFLIKSFGNEANPVKSAVDYMREGVSPRELQAFNRKMGYKSNIPNMKSIRSLVEKATGQDEKIPRMFIFGKKIGAYTLNLTGDSRYTTIDVWESRFIRSYFEGLFENNTGVPVTVDEDTLFQEFSSLFKEEFDKVSGLDADPASLQAMRWFYMIDAAKKSGYRGASTNETISEITDRYITRDRDKREDSRRQSDEAPVREVQREEQLQEELTPRDLGIIEPKPSTFTSNELDSISAKNEEVAAKAPPTVIPKINLNSPPEVQAVAAEPEKGRKLDDLDRDLFSRKNKPQLPPEQQAELDKLVGDKPGVDKTPGEGYLEIVGGGKLGEMFDRVRKRTANRYARLERLYKNSSLGLKDLLADSSAMAAVLLSDRASAITSSALRFGVPVYENGVTTVEPFEFKGKKYKGLIDVMAPLYDNKYKVNLEDIAQAYAVARRGKRLNAEGKAVPGTEESFQEINKIAQKYINPETGNSIIEEWYAAWQAYNKNTVQFLKNTGVLDNETADLWLEQSDYVPFYRQATEDGADLGSDVPRVFSGMTAAVQFTKLKGSERAVDVPLQEAIARNLATAIEMGMKNVAQQRIARDLVKIGLAKEVPSGAPKGEQPIVDLRVQGKKRSFIVNDPLLYETMLPMGGGYELLENVLGAPASFLREMVTRDPIFAIRNMMRDTLAAWVTTGSSFTPVLGTVKGLASGARQLERFGVIGGYDFKNDPKDIVAFVNKESRKRGIPTGSKLDNPVFHAFSRMWDGLGYLSTLSDAATRNAVYEDVLARTGNEAEAAFQALEVINFGRRGDSPLMRVLTSAIPFLNARIQGLDVLARAYAGSYSAKNPKESRGSVAASALARSAILTGLTGLYYLLVSDDDQYKDQSEFIKDNNFIIPTAAGVPILIPIPFEIGLLFKTIPERILDKTVGESSTRDVAQTVARGVASTLEINPLGIQAAAPVIESYLNYSFFTGRPIVPYYIDQNVIPMLQSRLDSSVISQAVAEFLDKGNIKVSPLKIDHILTGYGGTLGTYVLDAVDALLRNVVLPQDNTTVLPKMKLTEYPLIKRFFAKEFPSGPAEDFYEIKNRIDELVGSLNQLNRQGRTDEAVAFIELHGSMLGMKDAVNELAKELSDLNRLEREVLTADMTAEEKRDLQDQIRSAKMVILKSEGAKFLRQEAQLPAMEVRPLN